MVKKFDLNSCKSVSNTTLLIRYLYYLQYIWRTTWVGFWGMVVWGWLWRCWRSTRRVGAPILSIQTIVWTDRCWAFSGAWLSVMVRCVTRCRPFQLWQLLTYTPFYSFRLSLLEYPGLLIWCGEHSNEKNAPNPFIVIYDFMEYRNSLVCIS